MKEKETLTYFPRERKKMVQPSFKKSPKKGGGSRVKENERFLKPSTITKHFLYICSHNQRQFHSVLVSIFLICKDVIIRYNGKFRNLLKMI